MTRLALLQRLKEVQKMPRYQGRDITTISAGLSNEALARHGIAGKAGGPVSLVPVTFSQPKLHPRKLVYRFRAAMQLGGVDPSGMNFIVSATHGQAEIDQTIDAFDKALGMLKDEGSL